jgi:hypothetical protein
LKDYSTVILTVIGRGTQTTEPLRKSHPHSSISFQQAQKDRSSVGLFGPSRNLHLHSPITFPSMQASNKQASKQESILQSTYSINNFQTKQHAFFEITNGRV